MKRINLPSITIPPRPDKRRIPVIPPVIPPKDPVPIDPNPTVAICGACGLECKQVMGYSCSRPDCPIFPQFR